MKTTKLEKLNACYDAREWVSTQKNPTEAWKNCERGDWMQNFFTKIKIPENIGNDCWLWTGCKSRNRGMFRFQGKMKFASQIMWTLCNGIYDKGLCVCHTCDNPICVNPNHLFLGTHKQNMEDKKEKGRVNYGSNGYKDKTHCPQGHSYSEDNLYIFNNMRYCRKCASVYKMNYKLKKKGVTI